MSSVARVTGPDGYVLCPEDSFWFRPAYTEGKCPLCGEVAPGGTPPPSWLVQIDRSWLAMAMLGLLSLAMAVLVLLMYFRA